MKAFNYLGMTALAVVCALSACTTTPKKDPRQLDPKQASELAALGTRDFGIQWEGPLVGAHERGVVAVTDGVTTLTQRAGARVFIVHNRKEFPPTEQTAFAGSDAELADIGTKFLQAAGVGKDEIANTQVLQQFTQSGEVLPGGKEVKVLPPQKSYRTLMVSRRIGGVDVVSSRLMLNLDRAGRVAFMEMAWPEISREVLDRAARYQVLAAGKFVAPRVEGAEVESVQAVVLHTPAIGFYNDTTAAIRVIYRPISEQVGQKAVRYVDEQGKDVVPPRDIERLREPPVQREERKPQ